MDSSIWVATMTGFPWRLQQSMMRFCVMGTSSGGISTPRSPLRVTEERGNTHNDREQDGVTLLRCLLGRVRPVGGRQLGAGTRKQALAVSRYVEADTCKQAIAVVKCLEADTCKQAFVGTRL